MSAELADSDHKPYWTHGPSATLFAHRKGVPRVTYKVNRHEPIHNLEAFFWILCWLCISYNGPGRRVVLNKKSSEDKRLKNIIYKLFDGDHAGHNVEAKRNIITRDLVFERNILDNIQPYFLLIHDTIIELYLLLQTAYQTRTWPTIHEDFLLTLSKANTLLSDAAQDNTTAEYQEMEQIQRDLRALDLFPRANPLPADDAKAAEEEASDEEAAEEEDVVEAEEVKMNDASNSKTKRKADTDDYAESSGAKKSKMIS